MKTAYLPQACFGELDVMYNALYIFYIPYTPLPPPASPLVPTARDSLIAKWKEHFLHWYDLHI